jgi:hypothetical protein
LTRQPKWILVATLLVAAACKKGDGLVVVNVSAAPPITGVATLHVSMTVGSTQRTHDITTASSTIDDSGATSFGIDVSADFGSSITVHVDARGSAGSLIATGSGSGSIAAGKQTTINVALVGGVQGVGDMGPMPDLYGVTVCVFDDPNSTFDTNCVFDP